jgi:hypothetical protein
MAKPKKATKARNRARAKVVENVGPERGRLSRAAGPRDESYILEEAREVREKKHKRLSKPEIIAIGLAKARGISIPVQPRGVKGKSKVKEHSANAHRKSIRAPHP